LDNLQLVEIKTCVALPIVAPDQDTGVRIDDSSSVRPGFRLHVRVPPEVGELAFVLRNHEYRGTRGLVAPSLSAHRAQIGEREALSFIDHASILQPDLAHAMWLHWVATISHVFDQKG